MRRVGFVLGFSTGYYLGAMAGRSRYEQINRLVTKVRRTKTYEAATERARGVAAEATGTAKAVVEEVVDRAKDAAEEGVERAKEVVEEHRGGNGHEPAPTTYDGLIVPGPSPGPPAAGSLDEDRP